MTAITRAPRQQTATIANGSPMSSAIDLVGYASTGFVLPGAFTSTAISFLVSADGQNFAPLYNASGSLEQINPVAPGNAYAIPADAMPFAAMKILGNQNEAAARTIAVSSKG